MEIKIATTKMVISIWNRSIISQSVEIANLGRRPNIDLVFVFRIGLYTSLHDFRREHSDLLHING